jgi:hypothetical protein
MRAHAGGRLQGSVVDGLWIAPSPSADFGDNWYCVSSVRDPILGLSRRGKRHWFTRFRSRVPGPVPVASATRSRTGSAASVAGNERMFLRDIPCAPGACGGASPRRRDSPDSSPRATPRRGSVAWRIPDLRQPQPTRSARRRSIGPDATPEPVAVRGSPLDRPTFTGTWRTPASSETEPDRSARVSTQLLAFGAAPINRARCHAGRRPCAGQPHGSGRPSPEVGGDQAPVSLSPVYRRARAPSTRPPGLRPRIRCARCARRRSQPPT